MSFAEAARRLAGQAGLLLGWRPDDFWRATPDELEAAFAVLADSVIGDAAPLDGAVFQKLKEMHPDGGADG